MEHDEDNDLFDHTPAERPRNWYEQKQEARRERMADQAMRRGVEVSKHADELERRASSPTNAISSDDPDAVVKLREKIAEAEAKQAMMAAANKVVRAAIKRNVLGCGGDGWADYLAKMAAISPALSADVAAKLIEPDFCGRPGFPDYALSNNSANIRRMKLRVEQLLKAETRETVEREPVEGLRIVENADANRVQIVFPGKPEAEVRAMLKSLGFRWAPSESAWQRQLNNAGRWNAERFATWYAERSAVA